MVAVDMQLPGDRFFFHSKFDCIKNRIYCLFGSCLVSNNTVVKEVTNARQFTQSK